MNNELLEALKMARKMIDPKNKDEVKDMCYIDSVISKYEKED